MKLSLVLLVLLPLVLAAPAEEKRFLEFLHLDSVGVLVSQLNNLVHGGTGHDACVATCQSFAGAVSFLCDTACTTALAAIPDIPTA